MRVLVVEDEAKLAGLLRRGFVEEGHAADVAGTGDEVTSSPISDPLRSLCTPPFLCEPRTSS